MRQSGRYLGIEEFYKLKSDYFIYKETIDDVDIDLWQKAIVYYSPYTLNKIWDLIDPPGGVKPFRYKLVYKRKKGIDRKVKTFKVS